MTTSQLHAACIHSAGHRHTVRRAFTLFEVAISLVLVAFGVVSVLMLFPAGLKAQQMARFQIYAATKAEEMIEQFNGAQSASPAIDSEGLAMWDVPVTHKPQSWDLEAKLSAHRFGIMPLPLDIARRIDSDGDEIKGILDQGGYVYYSQPLASTNMQEQGLPLAPPNDAQKLIIGVRGYAQQNGLASFPLKNWPYHTPYPSPPLHMHHMADKFLPPRDYGTQNYYNYYSWPWTDIEDQKSGVRSGQGNWSETHCVPWETSPAHTYDPDIQKVYDWPDETLTMEVPGRDGKAITTKVHWGYFPYACGRLWSSGATHTTSRSGVFPDPWKGDSGTYEPTHLGPDDRGAYPSRDSVKRYVATTLWYALRKNIVITSSDGDKDPYQDFTLPESDRWKEVQAYRFLAHATTCLTSWFSYDETETEELQDGAGVPIPQFKQGGVESPMGFKVTHKLIKYLHERSLYLINQFAAKYPYDWSVPRPLNRVTMMDFPLLQFDLFTPPLPYGMDITTNWPFGGQPPRPLYNFKNDYSGVIDSQNTWDRIFGRADSDKPQQWRVVSSEPIRNVGVSATFPTSVINATMQRGNYAGNSHFGNIDHYNLTDKFAADERCRELIFWVVDWQSYEDFETAPSAPVDAGKYPIGGPRCNWHNSMDVGGAYGSHQVPTYRTRTFDERMIDMEFVDQQLATYRNPEKTLLYWVDTSNLQTGTDMSGKMILNNVDPKDGRGLPDKGPSVEARKTFCGLYGADRNFNKKLDRGPVPRSVRLRAVEVARFNFYDPRLQTVVR